MKQLPIMAHMVIGYPNLEASRVILDTYVAHGVDILEIQIPFSHPTADGSTLSAANQVAIANGTSMADCMTFLQDFRAKYPEQKAMVMTYLNKAFSYGMTQFCDALKDLSIPYLIIPDLPFDSQLATTIHQHDYVQLVPVVASNTTGIRFDAIMDLEPDYVYAMADFKITGSGFSIHPKVADLVTKMKDKVAHTKVGLGFGISTPEQVDKVLEVADFAIIGSAFKIAVDEGKLAEKLGSYRSA